MKNAAKAEQAERVLLSDLLVGKIIFHAVHQLHNDHALSSFLKQKDNHIVLMV